MFNRKSNIIERRLSDRPNVTIDGVGLSDVTTKGSPRGRAIPKAPRNLDAVLDVMAKELLAVDTSDMPSVMVGKPQI